MTADDEVIQPKKDEVILVEGDKINVTCAASKFLYEDVSLKQVQSIQGRKLISQSMFRMKLLAVSDVHFNNCSSYYSHCKNWYVEHVKYGLNLTSNAKLMKFIAIPSLKR